MTMFNPEGGFDFNALLQQAQALQQQVQDAQANLADQTVTGSAGGGLVKLTMTGTQQVTAVEIDPSACDPSDVETLQDLIVAAFRDAATQAQELASAALPQVPGMSF